MWNVLRQPLTRNDLKVVLGCGLAGVIFMYGVFIASGVPWDSSKQLLGGSLLGLPGGLFGGVVWLLVQRMKQ